MIVTALRYRRVPRWYVRRVMRRLQRLCVANPGFHRLLIDLPGLGSTEAAWLIDPAVEPEARRLLSRIMVLAPSLHDDDPWRIL